MNTEPSFQKLEDGRVLRRIDYKVRPSPDHPLFWERQHGILAIWLYAASEEDLVERANGLLAALPFEQISEQTQVCVATPVPPISIGGALTDISGRVESAAKSVGCSFHFSSKPLGDSEEDLAFP